MKVNWTYFPASLASGGIWAMVAYGIGHEWIGDKLWGGLVVSPLIGLIVGLIYLPAYRLPMWGRILMAVVTLYLAAVLFGIAIGLKEAHGSAVGSTLEWCYGNVLGVLWGLTFTGYVALLWPLACVNHALLGRLVHFPKVDTKPSP